MKHNKSSAMRNGIQWAMKGIPPNKRKSRKKEQSASAVAGQGTNEETLPEVEQMKKKCDICGNMRKTTTIITNLGGTEIDRDVLCRECMEKHVTITVGRRAK